jgi:hypothetical protein
MLDRADARLLGKLAIVVVAASTLLVVTAGAIGLAWRALTLAAS